MVSDDQPTNRNDFDDEQSASTHYHDNIDHLDFDILLQPGQLFVFIQDYGG